MNLDGIKLRYDAEAHFRSMGRFPDGLGEALLRDDEVSFEALCFALEIMSRRGSAWEKYIGNEETRIMTEEEARMNMRIRDIKTARIRVLDALTRGLRGEEDEDEERDLVLEELEKKETAD